MGTYDEQTRVCKRCGRRLTLHHFKLTKSTNDGITKKCTDCIEESYERARERARKNQKFWEMDWACRPDNYRPNRD